VKLVGCPECHAQYDVDGRGEATVTCRCGATFPAVPPAAVDAAVTRCAACGALVGEAEATCAYCHAEIVRRPQTSGPVCPSCYARNPEKAKFCTSCGLEFRPQPIRSVSGSLRCPACPESTLVPRGVGGVWLEECPACLGLWAPGDVMDRLVERIREKRRHDAPLPTARGTPERRATWQADVTYRHCPECGGMMQRRNFGRRSGVIVDWCGEHGTWLDANEMEDIASFVFQGGLEGPQPAGAEPGYGLPADPKHVAAMAAAERILAEERARGTAAGRGWESAPIAGLKGIGDLIALLLK
jgi:Zn-finger nucleic acid-binding protein/ribosomal protein L40E